MTAICTTTLTTNKESLDKTNSRDGGSMERERPFYTLEQVKEKVKEGKLWLIIENKIYDVTKWAHYHPGGKLALENLAGVDATDEMRVLHPDYVYEEKLPRFCVGRLEAVKSDSIRRERQEFNSRSFNKAMPNIMKSKKGSDALKDEGVVKDEMYDGIRGNSPISVAFRELKEEIKRDGLEDTNPWFYIWLATRLGIQFMTAIALVVYGSHNTWCCILSACLLAGFWQQIAFIAHDAGHNGITHDLATDHFIGIFLANFCGGLSIGWWKLSHYVHHVVTNDPENDPDIQHLPFFAVTTRFFDHLYSTYHKRRLVFDTASKILVSIQHFSYYPIMLFGRFNLFAQSIIYLVNHDQVRNRRLELFGCSVFWVWYISLLSQLPTWNMVAVYALLSNGLTMILHVQITLSHFSMSTEPSPDTEEFIRHQLRTSLDVDCPEWMDWFHGGLQFQVAHHLFPRVPRHNLRLVRGRIIKLCEKFDLPYYSVPFVRGNGLIIGALKEVADQVKFYAHVTWKEVHEH